ncbi:MAG TPA: DNA gyrase inhibitor YacG [Dongiaceae bacterium]|nr:DNA gyrase inhibitor YacG [Dongiaceae bacterium]
MSARCPICGKPVAAAFRPFCSARCKQIDLNRWLSEAYRVPDRPGADDDEAAVPPRPGARPDPEDEP